MSEIKIVPRGDMVLLKEERLKLTKSKIIIPNIGSETPLTCKVIAIGEGKLSEWLWKTVPMKYKVGDLVLSPAFGGRQVEINNEKYILIGQDAILANLEEVEEVI